MNIDCQPFYDAAKAIEDFGNALNKYSELVKIQISELKQKAKEIKLSPKEIKELRELENFFSS